jgi:hypothetical protein
MFSPVIPDLAAKLHLRYAKSLDQLMEQGGTPVLSETHNI